jgi:hypothetical protein
MLLVAETPHSFDRDYLSVTWRSSRADRTRVLRAINTLERRCASRLFQKSATDADTMVQWI